MTTKRMTKRELREDPALEAFHKASHWAHDPGHQARLRQVLIGVGVLAVVLVGVAFYQANARHDAELASEALLKAEVKVGQGDATGGLAALTEVRTKYGKTPSGLRAIREIADVRFAQGNIPEAQKLYTEYLSRAPRGGIEDRAGQLGLASCLEQQRQFPKAAEAYEQVAGLKGADEFVAMALWSAGRCWMAAGQYDKAAADYGKIVSDHPNSRYNDFAKQEQAEAMGHSAH